jgi:hypothetical protein
MKRNATFVFIVCGFILLILVLTGQTLHKGEVDSTVVKETVSNDVATTSALASEETVMDEMEAVPPVEIAVIPPLVVEPDECVIIDNFAGGVPKLQWYTVNDGVMGGLSQGSASLAENRLVHSGVLNTNGGGFSYVGARLPTDIFSGYSRLQVRLNTLGRPYAVNFGDARNRRISHQAPIPLGPGNAWQEVFIEFDQTVPTIFSRRVNSAPFDASAIEELNFILADGINGPFKMEIDWIKACI